MSGKPIDVAGLRALLARGPATPWEYRPKEHDDWGFIRGTERDSIIGPVKPVVALAREDDLESDHDQHRRDKTDPYEPAGLLIVEAVNALPGILDELEALREAVADIAAMETKWANCTVQRMARRARAAQEKSRGE
jgi:hypothetical protein